MLDNPLQVNDWEIKKFLLAVIILQAAMLGLVILSTLGVDIPILRYFIGFIYLTFIPGIIILRILRMHQLGASRSLLYAVGLSLAFNMFLGCIINFLYPYLGITRPFSTLPLLITWIVALGILCLVAFERDRDFSILPRFNAHLLLTPPVLLLCLLPLLSVLATILLNLYVSTIPQLVVLAMIALVVILAVFSKFIKPDLYPIAVLSISLSLLLHQSLVGFYLNLYDTRIEYYINNLVVMQGFWDPINPINNYNAMLSITVLPTIYSYFLNIDCTWVFKVIWPILFSLTPLCLYQAYRIQTTDKNAFMAAFYFLIVVVCIVDMTFIPRQEIALFFLALLVLLFSEQEVSKLHRVILLLIYSIAIVVSHYSTAYLLAFYTIGALIIFLLFKRKGNLFSYGFATLLIVAIFAWYMFTTNSSILAAIINMGKHVSQVFFSELLSPFSRETMFMLTGNIVHPLNIISRGLMLLFQFFIAVGIGNLIVNRHSVKPINDYFAFSLISFTVLVLCVVVPYLSDYLSADRVYSLALPLLAPFCIYGGELSIELFGRLFISCKRWMYRRWHIRKGNIHELSNHLVIEGAQVNSSAKDSRKKIEQAVVFLLLLASFLMSSGFIIDIAGLKNWYQDLSFPGTTISASFSKSDTKAGEWLVSYMDYSKPAYADSSGNMFFFAYGPNTFVKALILDEKSMSLETQLSADAYLYLRGYNLQQRKILTEAMFWLAYRRGIQEVNLDDLISLDKLNTIYTNGGGAEIFKGRR
jgi:uncharacterized membrane protein